jgi:predicted O-methyltransferase YrrM
MSAARKFLILTYRLFSLALTRPRDLQYLLGIGFQNLDDLWERETDVRRLAAIDPLDLVAETEVAIVTHFFKGVPASVSQLEAMSLALLMKAVKARTAFEFGTYKGVSTTQLAANLQPDGTLYTLDLPEETEQATRLRIHKDVERQIAAEKGKGSLIPAELRSKIEFLRMDSADFDPASFSEKMDLVFVDGAHSVDYVRNDSEKGWRMVRPGGILIWHDCVPNHPDVVRYILNCGYATGRISGTSLAIARK